jgi:hypothetical protein
MVLTLEWPCDVGTRVRVTRSDGSETAVRLRLLGYDGCEFESDQEFVAGEKVAIHLYRMGLIRARIARLSGQVVEAEFDKDCPV